MQQGDINCKTHRTSCVQRHTIKRARAFAGVCWFGSLGTVETLEQTKPNLAPQSRGIMDVRYCMSSAFVISPSTILKTWLWMITVSSIKAFYKFLFKNIWGMLAVVLWNANLVVIWFPFYFLSCSL
jgi:hypothetical protein